MITRQTIFVNVTLDASRVLPGNETFNPPRSATLLDEKQTLSSLYEQFMLSCIEETTFIDNVYIDQTEQTPIILRSPLASRPISAS